MSEYDFARRLKRLVFEECEMVKAETVTAQKSIKYCKKLSAIKTTFIKQEQEFKKLRNLIQKMMHENGKLSKLKEDLEDQLTTLLQKMEQLEAEYNMTQQKEIEQNRTVLLKMDCFRHFKLATQTYINLKALPQLIQGVTVTEKNSSNQWNPFCINPLNYTQKEVENIIWHEPDSESELKKTWKALILGDILTDASEVTEMDTINGKVSVVV